MQGLPVQDLMNVPRVGRKVQVPPRRPCHSRHSQGSSGQEGQDTGGVLAGEVSQEGAHQQKALMKIVSRKYRQHFPEILSTAHEHLELVFGLEMKGNRP